MPFTAAAAAISDGDGDDACVVTIIHTGMTAILEGEAQIPLKIDIE